MAQATDLMGLGMNPFLANTLGNTAQTVTCAGTAQATAAAIRNKNVSLVPTSSNTGAYVPANATVGAVFYLNTFSTSATTSAVIYPSTSTADTFQNAQTSYTIAQNKAVIMWKTAQSSATVATWAAVLTA